MATSEVAASEDAWEIIDSTPAPLSDSFSSALSQIASQSEKNRDLVQRAISLVLRAKRPLYEDEFTQVMVMCQPEGEKQQDKQRLLDKLLPLSQGLIHRSRVGDKIIVGFVDTELSRYLESELKHLSWLKDSEDTLTQCCITIMQDEIVAWRPPNFGRNSPLTQQDAMDGYDFTPFFLYAATFWSEHAVETTSWPTICILAQVLQHSNFVRNAIMCLIPQMKRGQYPKLTEGSKLLWGGLHIAAYYGLDQVMSMIVSRGNDCFVDSVFAPSVDRIRSSPLYIAAERGHLETVNVLMETDVLCTQLQWNRLVKAAIKVTARNGHVGLVKSLLSYTAQMSFAIITPEAFRWAALQSARKAGQKEVMDYILADTPDIESNAIKSKYVSWPLSRSKQLRRLRVLTSTSDNINQYPDSHYTPLQIAVKSHSLEMVQYLLKKGADINLRQNKYASALSIAALTGQKETVKFLLDHGATVASSTITRVMELIDRFPRCGRAIDEMDEILEFLLGRQKSRSDELEDLQIVLKDWRTPAQKKWVLATTQGMIKKLELDGDYAGFGELFAALPEAKIEWPGGVKCPTLARLLLTCGRIYFHLDRDKYYKAIAQDANNPSRDTQQQEQYLGKERAAAQRKKSSPASKGGSSKPESIPVQREASTVGHSEDASTTNPDDCNEKHVDEKVDSPENGRRGGWTASLSGVFWSPFSSLGGKSNNSAGGDKS